MELLEVQNIISIASAIVGSGGILYGYQERRKRKLANKKTEVEILREYQEIYKTLISDLRLHNKYMNNCKEKKDDDKL